MSDLPGMSDVSRRSCARCRRLERLLTAALRGSYQYHDQRVSPWVAKAREVLGLSMPEEAREIQHDVP